MGVWPPPLNPKMKPQDERLQNQRLEEHTRSLPAVVLMTPPLTPSASAIPKPQLDFDAFKLPGGKAKKTKECADRQCIKQRNGSNYNLVGGASLGSSAAIR